MFGYGFTYPLVAGLSIGGEPMYRPRFSSPATVYVAKDSELNIYFDQLALIQPGAAASFTAVCDVGEIKDRGFRWLPTSAGITESLTVYALDANGRQVGSVVIALESIDDTAGAGSQRVMFMGDSLLANSGKYMEEFYDLVGAAGSVTPVPIGILGTSPDFHEGRSGRAYEDYAGASTPGYTFTVNNALIAVNPTAGATYTDLVSGFKFVFLEDRIDRFDEAFFTPDPTAPGTPAASGTLTKTAGTGDATIAWTAVVAEGRNPFYDDSNTRLDFQLYSTRYAQQFPDAVFMMFGVNDIFIPGGVLTSDADIAAIVANIQTIVTALQSATYGFPHCAIVIAIEPPGASLEAFGNTYGADDEYVAIQDGFRSLAEAIVTAYDAGAYDANVTVLGANLWIDRLYEYPTVSEDRNDRDNTAVDVQANMFHPVDNGHDQVADAHFSHFLALQPLTQNIIVASEDLSDATWNIPPGEFTETSNELAPDGVSDAYGFAYLSGDGAGEVSTDPLDALMAPLGAGRWILSAYMAQINAQVFCALRLFRTGSTNTAKFEWVGGELTASDIFGDSVASGVFLDRNGFYRAWVEYEVTATNLSWSARLSPNYGNTTPGNGVTVWGWELEKRTGGPGGYLVKP